MYDAVNDPYCYTGTKLLKNRAGIKLPKKLREFELAMTTQRFDEPLPAGRFSVSHYCAIHRHLFQDVYSWAGKFRNVAVGMGGYIGGRSLEKITTQIFGAIPPKSRTR